MTLNDGRAVQGEDRWYKRRFTRGSWFHLRIYLRGQKSHAGRSCYGQVDPRAPGLPSSRERITKLMKAKASTNE